VNGRFFFVVLVVALAGCGAVTDDTPRTEGETLTPVSVPEETPVELVPDDSRGGAGDVDALVRTHVSILRERSYVLRRTTRHGERVVEDYLRVESPQTYRYRRVTVRAPGNVTEYADGEHLYSRDARNGNRFNRTAAPTATDRYGELVTRIVRVHLPDDRGTIEEISYLGEPHFRIRATYDTHPEYDGVRNYSVRARIAQSGLIRSMTLSYVRIDGGERMNVTERFTYVRVGGVSVDRPVWVDRRWNETS